jgi:hypothetical protein
MDEKVRPIISARAPTIAIVLALLGSLFLAAFLSLLLHPRSLCGGLGQERASIVCPFFF